MKKSLIALSLVLFAASSYAVETKSKTTHKSKTTTESEVKSDATKSNKQAVNKHGKKSKKMGF